MVAVKLEPSAEHHADVFEQLRADRQEGQLCDVKVKSCDGTEHPAHKIVLCAASKHLRMMLLGPSQEADQVKDGQPVEIAASHAVVSALLEYIYGGELEVEVEDSFELLRLAEAYDLPKLVAGIETALCTSLDGSPVTTALKVLQQSLSLHALRVLCEEIVADNFESCIELVDFLELSVGQFGRILRRTDLHVSREEVVVQALLNWLKRSDDRRVHLPLLLSHIDLQSLSECNLARLGYLSANMGPGGHDLQTEVSEALEARKKRSAAETPEIFSPKRQCLQHWSAELGASQAPKKVLPKDFSLCWHDGAVYYAGPGPSGSSVFRWRPGETESEVVAGSGAGVNGVNDLGTGCVASVSPEGEIFVADPKKRRLVSFRHGSGNVVVDDVCIWSVSCSASGAVHVVTEDGMALEKLVGATLHQLAFLTADLSGLFVTRDETVYMSDSANSLIYRLKAGEQEPVVVSEAPGQDCGSPRSCLEGLCATEDERIYVADYEQRKVWAFHPDDTSWTEVVACPGELRPIDVLVQGRSVYVSMVKQQASPWGGPPTYSDADGVYEYLLPSELQLGLSEAGAAGDTKG